MTVKFNPPLIVNLTEWLAKHSVDVPNAIIKIYRAYYIGNKDPELEPSGCYYMLGDNGWNRLNDYAGALRNYAEPPEGAHARDYWFYNQCNFAARQALKEWQHEQTH